MPAVLLSFLFSILFLSSCGAPGDPAPPRPLVPQAVTDLAARQSGHDVLLTFTLPKTSVEGQPLEEPPEIEIYRGFVAADVTPGPKNVPEKPLLTIPAALVDTYLAKEKGGIAFPDTLKPDQLEQHAGEQVIYLVRTRASKRRASADSNLAALRVYPVPEPIEKITAGVTETAIELTWTPPERTTGRARIQALAGYRVYRAEAEPRADASADPAKARQGEPRELVGVTPSPSYRDSRFEFGRTYVYTVTCVAQYDVDSVESEPSAPVEVTPRDTFPPAAPRNLVVVLVPATPDTPMRLDLSWSISAEPDLAGYHVYRSELEGSPGARVIQELLLTPTFRDISVEPGRRYTFTVTALDRAGNESPRSAPVSESVPPRER